MAYVPGSHQAGGLTPVDITHRSAPYDILRDPSLANRDPVWVEVDPGAVVWHHGFTVHQAAANHSGTTRRVFTVVYIASDATRTKGWPCYPLDREGLAVGERLHGAGMPVLWPPPTNLPKTPTTIGEGTGPQMRSGF